MGDIRGVDSRLVISQSNGLLINRPNKNCIGWIGNKSNKRIDPNKGSLFPENKQTYMYAYLECESRGLSGLLIMQISYTLCRNRVAISATS